MDIGKSYLVEVGNMTSRNNYVFISNVYGWTRVSHLFIFCVVPLCVFAFLIQCCDVRYIFALKRCLVLLDLQLFVGGLMSYLRYLWLVAYTY
jgi:hypothetical protein